MKKTGKLVFAGILILSFFTYAVFISSATAYSIHQINPTGKSLTGGQQAQTVSGNIITVAKKNNENHPGKGKGKGLEKAKERYKGKLGKKMKEEKAHKEKKEHDNDDDDDSDEKKEDKD